MDPTNVPPDPVGTVRIDYRLEADGRAWQNTVVYQPTPSGCTAYVALDGVVHALAAPDLARADARVRAAFTATGRAITREHVVECDYRIEPGEVPA